MPTGPHEPARGVYRIGAWLFLCFFIVFLLLELFTEGSDLMFMFMPVIFIVGATGRLLGWFPPLEGSVGSGGAGGGGGGGGGC